MRPYGASGWLELHANNLPLGEYFLEQLSDQYWWLETVPVPFGNFGVILPPHLLPALSHLPQSSRTTMPAEFGLVQERLLSWIHETLFWGRCHWDDHLVPESDPVLQEDFITHFPGSSGWWYPKQFVEDSFRQFFPTAPSPWDTIH